MCRNEVYLYCTLLFMHREFATQISGKKVKASNPKAVVNVTINNELLNPSVEVEYSNCVMVGGLDL